MAATVQAIFQQHFDAYTDTHTLPLHHHKLARALMNCRTSALGGHIQSCPNGCIEGVWYNSCKHRSCPQCNALPTERWLDNQKARLLDCDHYHVIFTLPHQLNTLWSYNRRRMTDLLFQCASETLKELLADPRYLGATAGLLASLHTWGRNLSHHPHLHVLVTGGGWHPEHGWVPVANGYLLPFQVVRTLFRGKFMAALVQAHAAGQLQRPPTLSDTAFQRLCQQLRHKVQWNVHLKERYAHGRGVATYLARYVKGGPLSNGQLLHADAQTVVFRYTDHRDQQKKSLALTPEHFIERLLWHTPEPRQQGIRYYGLYHPQQRTPRAACRDALGQAPETAPNLSLGAITWNASASQTAAVARCAAPD